MRDELPSLTAIFVAFARAAVTIERGAPGEGLDPYARALLPAAGRAAIDAVSLAERVSPLVMRGVRLATLGLLDHLELRSLAIDRAIAAALADGASQLVIVGAGLDARARRLPEASRAVVFEVDHPATQRYKRARSPGTSTRFVAVDFERESLDAKLAASGHDAGARTAWIWEGVTMYLAPEATRATLETISARSAVGSTLAVTYVLPSVGSLGPLFKPLADRVLGALGEPLRGLYEPRALAALLGEAGFTVEDDSGIEDWAARFHGTAPRARLHERLAVAVKAPRS